MKLEFDASGVSLEQMVKAISLEANFVDNALYSIVEFFPKLGNNLRDVITSFTDSEDVDTPKKSALSTERDFKVISKRIYAHSFLDFQDILVQVPEGFRGSLIDYTKLLININADIFKETLAVIGDYNLVLASFITNKEDKTSLRIHTQIYTRADAKRQQVLKELAAYFNDGSDLSRLPLKSVLSRFTDVETMVAEVTILTRDNHNKNLQNVKSAITETLSYLDKITKNTEMTNVSGDTAKQLATCAMSVAKLVEACSVYAYKVRQVVESSKSIVETLDRITKQGT
jgi:methyl-accepting chemotaxis protein